LPESSHRAENPIFFCFAARKRASRPLKGSPLRLLASRRGLPLKRQLPKYTPTGFPGETSNPPGASRGRTRASPLLPPAAPSRSSSALGLRVRGGGRPLPTPGHFSFVCTQVRHFLPLRQADGCPFPSPGGWLTPGTNIRPIVSVPGNRHCPSGCWLDE